MVFHFLYIVCGEVWWGKEELSKYFRCFKRPLKRKIEGKSNIIYLYLSCQLDETRVFSSVWFYSPLYFLHWNLLEIKLPTYLPKSMRKALVAHMFLYRYLYRRSLDPFKSTYQLFPLAAELTYSEGKRFDCSGLISINYWCVLPILNICVTKQQSLELLFFICHDWPNVHAC